MNRTLDSTLDSLFQPKQESQAHLDKAVSNCVPRTESNKVANGEPYLSNPSGYEVPELPPLQRIPATVAYSNPGLHSFSSSGRTSSETGRPSLADRMGPIPRIEIRRDVSETSTLQTKSIIVPLSGQTPISQVSHTTSKLSANLALDRSLGRSRPKLLKHVLAILDHDPVLKDEVQVSVGDFLSVIKVFKDEWVLGKNETTGVYGIFPLSCFDQHHTYSSHEVETPGMASIAPSHASGGRFESIGGLMDFWMKPDSMSTTRSIAVMTPPRLLKNENTHQMTRETAKVLLADQTVADFDEADPYHYTKPLAYTKDQKIQAFICSFLFIVFILSLGLHISPA